MSLSRSMKSVAGEALLLGIIGATLAFLANAASPHGLKLARNYSPGGALAKARSLAGPGTNAEAALQLLGNQFKSEGLQLADSNLVARFFADPAKDSGQVIFIDARDDDHYLAGHVPGAYQLDHYHPEKYLAEVLPACQVAQTILVYCKGGNCEDSEQTAIFLRDSGVAKERLYVYAGGFDEWTANRLPVEAGQRNSGQLLEPPPVNVTPATK